MKKFIITGMMFSFAQVLWAQWYSEKINKELSFEKKTNDNTVIIANINGEVKVVGYDGDKVIVEVEKRITGKTDERLERGKSEVNLGIIDLADTLILFIDGYCNSYGKNTSRRGNNRETNGWGYDWNRDCNGRDGYRPGYEYRMNFIVKVPSSVHLSVSTVNNGDVQVENVKGSVLANNVNGAIRLTKLTGRTEAHTINGDVDLDYDVNPQSDCRYYSLNGDINANFKKGLAASVSFESFNGDFYTNVPKLESLPVELERKETHKGLKFKVGGNRYKIGAGGVKLDFETFNGDVFLKEI